MSLQDSTYNTRALFASSEMLLDLEAGIRPYFCEEGGLREVLYLPEPIPVIFYEVSVTGAGSWWLPVSTEPGMQWQGEEPLRAEGYIATEHFQRPRRLLWWIPAQALDPYLPTVNIFGRVLGRWPENPPPKATF